MRFAWLRKNSTGGDALAPDFASRLILTVYNLVWWMPAVFVLTKTIDYRTGFITFALITAIRLAANLYRNNVLTLEQAERFPLRSP